ncbi:hypothetical protein ACTFIR_012848 [Dictyostelium discoideum]
MKGIKNLPSMVKQGYYMYKTRYQESLPPRISRSTIQRLIPLRVESSSYLYNAVRPVLRMFRDINVSVIAYLEDLLIVGSTKEECLSNLKKSMELLVKLGFKLNLDFRIYTESDHVTYIDMSSYI